jgi:hypothetical protein
MGNNCLSLQKPSAETEGKKKVPGQLEKNKPVNGGSDVQKEAVEM